MRSWNPLWNDLVRPGNPAYTCVVRKMVMASINWIEAHPDADPEWKELDVESVAKAAGIDTSKTPLDQITFAGLWQDFYIPENGACAAWFEAIDKAGSRQGTSAMMDKAILAGLFIKLKGWDEFNYFMLYELGLGERKQ